MLKRKPASCLVDITARRIALIKPSAFGDVVQTLPLLPMLEARFPDATITWAINQELAELVIGHPSIDDTILLNRRGGFSDWTRLLREIRRRRFDLVFDLQGLLRTAAMNVASRAEFRVGLESAREGSHLTHNCIIPRSGRLVSAHRRYWRVAEALGMGEFHRETIVSVSDSDRAWVSHVLQNLTRPILAIQPAARWLTKRWPVEKFAGVAAKAMRRYGCTVVILGSSADEPLCNQLEQLLERLCHNATVLNFAGAVSLKRLAALLAACDILLCNDSGPMHLAAGLGTPVVVPFTCTTPERSAPPGTQHEFLTTNIRCAGSYKKTCPKRGRKHLACMDTIATEQVWTSLVRVMERAAPTHEAA